MMIRNVLLLSLLVLPEAVEAQRGGSGAPPVTTGPRITRGDRRANYRIDASAPISISNKDVESLSPVTVFLDRKKDLALTDDQIMQLKGLGATLKTQNDTLFRQLDSLRKEMRENKNATNPQVEQLRVRAARTGTVEVIKAIREGYDKAEPEALALLDEAQQKTANDVLDKHQQEAEEMLQKKLGARRRG